MLKHKLLPGIALIVIFLCAYSLLKIIFDAPSPRSTATVASTATPSSSSLLVSATPGLEPAPEPTRAAPTATVASTATPSPSSLLVSATPGLEPAPEPTRTAPTTTVASTATPSPSSLLVSATPSHESLPEPAHSTPTTTLEPPPTRSPLKSRVVKHQPNQFRKGALSKEELAAIKKALRTIQWSRNSNPKAAADEDYEAIVKACATSSLHDLLADLITEATSNDYQPGNEAANNTYTAELISNFETNVKEERKAKQP